MCLVVQESLAFEEVLSSLEGALLLHLLKAIFIRLKNVLSRVLKLLLLLIYVAGVLIFKVQIGRRIVVFASTAVWSVKSLISLGWPAIWKWNSIDVVSNKRHVAIAILVWFLAAWRWNGTVGHVNIHVASVSYGWRTISVNTMPFWWFIFPIKVHLRFKLIN